MSRLRFPDYLLGMFEHGRPDGQKIDRSALSIGAILHLLLHPSSRFGKKPSQGKPNPNCESIEKLKSAQQNND